jgi:hypothetical protein
MTRRVLLSFAWLGVCCSRERACVRQDVERSEGSFPFARVFFWPGAEAQSRSALGIKREGKKKVVDDKTLLVLNSTSVPAIGAAFAPGHQAKHA